MFPNAVFELLLRDVQFSADAMRARSGRHLLHAALVWPRPLIANRTALQQLALQDGRCDRANAGWHERILFKERVQGRFALVLELSDIVSDAAMDALLRTVVSQTLRQSASDLADAATGSFLAGIGAAPFAALARDMAKPSGPAIIGRGALNTDSATLNRDAAQTHVIDLLATRTLTRTHRRADGETSRRIRRTLVQKDAVLGQVRVDVLPAG